MSRIVLKPPVLLLFRIQCPINNPPMTLLFTRNRAQYQPLEQQPNTSNERTAVITRKHCHNTQAKDDYASLSHNKQRQDQ